MKRAAGIAACALLAACGFSPESLPPGEVFGERLLSGKVDLESYDFAAAGYWALTSEEQVTWRSPVFKVVATTQVSSDSCEPVERRRFAAISWLQLLSMSPDEASWKANWTGLRKSLALHDADVQAAGDKVQDGKDAQVTELARRVARDQIIRDAASTARWTANLPDGARGTWFAVALVRMNSIDCDDTRWLAAQLREIKWFDIPTYGEEADRNAWVLVQHADRTPEFQRDTLALLRGLPPGATHPKNLAYLDDRVAVSEQRPQRFGTQGQCTPDGLWIPLPIDDPESVDARRADIGLPPMAEYAKSFEGACPRVAAN